MAKVLTRSRAGRISRTGGAAGAQPLRLFGTVRWRNQFELANIIRPIIGEDEYGLGGRNFEPNDVIIDVGAHIGVFTALCHKRGSRSIYAFEPDGENFRLLDQNLGACPGIHLSRQAVWRSDQESAAGLLLSGSDGENTGAHSLLTAGLVPDFGVQTVREALTACNRVDTIPLDRVLRRFECIKLLKIDCEGSEFPILLTSQLLDRVECIVGEIHEVTELLMQRISPDGRLAGYNAYRSDDLATRLRSIGFDVKTRCASPYLHILIAVKNATALCN